MSPERAKRELARRRAVVVLAGGSGIVPDHDLLRAAFDSFAEACRAQLPWSARLRPHRPVDGSRMILPRERAHDRSGPTVPVLWIDRGDPRGDRGAMRPVSHFLAVREAVVHVLACIVPPRRGRYGRLSVAADPVKMVRALRAIACAERQVQRLAAEWATALEQARQERLRQRQHAAASTSASQ